MRVCCHVLVSATRRSLVQRRGNEDGVSGRDLERPRRGLGPPELPSHVKRKRKVVSILRRSGSTTTHIIQLGTRCRAPQEEPKVSIQYDVDTYVCPRDGRDAVEKKSLPLPGIEREVSIMTEISSFQQN